MFERFTERSRQVVMLAQDEARRRDHDYLSTEHLLVGLLDEGDAMAAQVLAELGVEIEAVRVLLDKYTPFGEEPVVGQIAFTPRAKTLFQNSLREALSLGHNYIGTEHILLGILRDPQCLAVRILSELMSMMGDETAALVRETTMGMLISSRRPEPPTARREPEPKPGTPDPWAAFFYTLMREYMHPGALMKILDAIERNASSEARVGHNDAYTHWNAEAGRWTLPDPELAALAEAFGRRIGRADATMHDRERN